MIGRVLNERYRIDCKIGSGGMADVYRAFDVEKQKDVAIKVLKADYSEDPQYLRRFMREAQAMMNLSHDNIVSLYDVGDDGDVHYLVIELVSGCTLRDYIKKHGALSPHIAAKITCSVLDGLSHAHEKGLVHRDVKPQNVMISADKTIKLMDFGIAKFADSSTRTFDRAEALGSVYYLSPEQAKGEDVDAQTDIYSTGIMLYEMLTGQTPFNGETPVQIALKHINDEIIPPNELNYHIPIAISDVVMKATAKDKELRYKSADDMKKDLMRALRQPKSRFAAISRVSKNAKGPQKANAKTDGDKPGFLSKHGASIIILIAVVAIIAIFITMFFLWLKGRTAGDEEYLKVPELLGMTEDDAREYAENRSFYLEVKNSEQSDYPAGEVCDQTPGEHQKALPGSTIYVTISLGASTVKMPNLIGLTYIKVERALKDAGLNLDPNIGYETSEEEYYGKCIYQSETADTDVMLGESIKIIIGQAYSSEVKQMPNLTECADVSAAVERLRLIGVESYRIYISDYADSGNTYEEGQIVSQSPAAGINVTDTSIIVEIYIYMSSMGNYCADFSQNITMSGQSNEVLITVSTSIGEVVLFSGQYESGTVTIPFTAYLWEGGSHLCIVYVNGEVYSSFNREFIHGGQGND